jgi:hypothetical protein
MAHLGGPDGLPPYDPQPVLLPESPSGLPPPRGRPRPHKKRQRWHNSRAARLPVASLTRAAAVIMAVAAVAVAVLIVVIVVQQH